MNMRVIKEQNKDLKIILHLIQYSHYLAQFCEGLRLIIKYKIKYTFLL